MKYCNKKIKLEVYVSNGWHDTCEVRCGWKNNNTKYQCDKCKNN